MRGSIVFIFLAAVAAQESKKICATELDLFRIIATLPEPHARAAIDNCRLTFSWSDALERKMEGALLGNPNLEDEAARARVSNYIRTKLPVAGPLARTRDGRVGVYIPGGSFLRGCEGTREEHPECEEDEFPAKTIRMSGFWMGATEVTQKDYEWALRKEPGAFRVKGNPSYFKGPSLPVDSITWYDAQAFCRVIGMGLPTEAQWEYAARGGTKNSRYHKDLKLIAWFNENSGYTTHAVRNKLPNAHGLFDMLGNVWEWVTDWFDAKSYAMAELENPKGPQTETGLKVLRGGAAYHSEKDLRAAYRIAGVPAESFQGSGFRCAGE